MFVWRCVHRNYAASAWTGEGARKYGGRWNPEGRAMVYASEHAALAVLEVMAGGVRSSDLHEWCLLRASVPDEAVAVVPKAANARTQGVLFLDSGALALAVPSAVVPGSNILLNPSSSNWNLVEVDKDSLILDPRLWGDGLDK